MYLKSKEGGKRRIRLVVVKERKKKGGGKERKRRIKGAMWLVRKKQMYAWWKGKWKGKRC